MDTEGSSLSGVLSRTKFSTINATFTGKTSFSSRSDESSTSVERSAKYSFNLETPHLTSSSIGTTGSKTDPIRKSTSGATRSCNSSRIHRQQTPYTGGSISTIPGSRRTPRTVGTPHRNQSSNVAAVVEGRGLAKGEIGLTNIDLKGSELVLSQFSDGPTYVKILTKLQIMQPIEIIMPNTACENGNRSALFQVITDQFPYITLTTVQRKYFNESKGLEYIKHLCVPEFNTVEMDVQSKYYCLATTAALLKYVEFIQNIVFAPSSLKIVYKGGENTTLIDASASKNLELIVNARDPKSDHSLYGVLNYTKTAGGARLLRSNILQPPCDLSTIESRYDCIDELIEKEDLFLNLQTVLGRFLDVDHLISSLIQIPKKEGMKVFERKVSEVIYLKHTIELVQTLHQALTGSENSLFKAYHKSLDDERFQLILDNIQTVIHNETRYQKGTLNMKTQKLFAVKPNINGLLDVARRTHCEVVDDISEIIKQEGETSGLPLTPSYNATRGFYIQINTKGHEDLVTHLPDNLIKVVKTKSIISCTTEDLIKLNSRLEESLEEIYFLSNIIISELMKNIRDQIGCLYKLAECVSVLDMIVSFSHAATLSTYVRPEFTDTLAIKQGRHPILDKMLMNGPPVANDTYASDVSNFIVITGPNMSGKSTYLRQIALLQIMAQCGSYVPAEYASFRLANQVFVRVGSDDDIETNCSTFMMENISDNSLLIVDELGRGTSVDEGIGISYSICEHILSKKAFTFFATHFMEICDLENMYPNVENYHLAVQRSFNSGELKEKISFSHILVKGKTEEKRYGLELAEMTNLPKDIITTAKAAVETIIQAMKVNEETSRLTKRERATFKLGTRLLQAAKNSRLDDETLRFYLKGLRTQYENEIQDDAVEE